MSNNKKNEKRDIPFDYLVDRKEIHWADLVSIKFSGTGFLFSFAQFNPHLRTHSCVTEVIIPPGVAKSFSTILVDSLANYEKTYKKKIKVRKKPSKKKDKR